MASSVDCAYAELHALSHFTFLRGASSPAELVERATALGYRALALTDECSVAGVVQAHAAARGRALQLIVGSGLRLADGLRLVLLAADRAGYGDLCERISRARRATTKGRYRLQRADLESIRAGCLALWLPSREPDPAALSWLRECFPGRLWIAAELAGAADDRNHLRVLDRLAERSGVPLVAAGDVHMHLRRRRYLQDTLTAIRIGRPLAQAGYALCPSGERHLRSRSVLARRYPRELLDETLTVAECCRFSLDELRYEYPEEGIPAGHTPIGWLRELTEQGLRRRWPGGVPDKVRALIERELALIAELGYEHYFLTVHDLVAFARSQDIYCQGRGSAANSAVCYALGITEVDPARMEMLFERFISRERDEPPDIDVDFESGRREEVLQYIYRRYGRERAAMTATVITYRTRSAVRDVGMALGLSEDRCERLAALSGWSRGEVAAEQLREAGLAPDSPTGRQLRCLVTEIQGCPRHSSQHPGGMVISRGPLARLVPIENAAMAERTVIQWTKDDLDELGLLKVDCLGLGMLSALHRAIDLVNEYHGTALTRATIPAEDPAVYAMIQRADTIGVFQIESRAQMTMLPRLRPANFFDLVIEVAIIRPGPIQGGMVHPYLRRRRGEEPVRYPHPSLEPVLARTLGIAVFQEQIMRMGIAAGFSAGEADRLRRALASTRGEAAIRALKERFIGGMRERGYCEATIEQVWQQVQGFAGYGFPESHAASFALIAYQSAWLKCHHPAAFCAGLLNSQPMGFYAPAQLIADAERHGVEVRPISVVSSARDCTLERGAEGAPALRLGLRLVKGLSKRGAERLLNARSARAFISIDDLVQRGRLSSKDRRALAAAEALQPLTANRRQGIWQVLGSDPATPLDLQPAHEATPLLPHASLGEELIADYAATGLSLRPHPLSLLRRRLERRGVIPVRGLRDCADGEIVRTVGLVLHRQRPPSAKGVVFITLEDETGLLNLIVPPRLLERQARIVTGAALIEVRGRIERDGEVVQLLARRLFDRSALLGALRLRSRDFR